MFLNSQGKRRLGPGSKGPGQEAQPPSFPSQQQPQGLCAHHCPEVLTTAPHTLQLLPLPLLLAPVSPVSPALMPQPQD